MSSSDRNLAKAIIRLSRHLNLAKAHGDVTSYEDLAHSMRIIVELKKEFFNYIKRVGPTQRFPSYELNQRAKMELGRGYFIYTDFSGAVTINTKASPEFDDPEVGANLFWYDGKVDMLKKKFSVIVQVKREEVSSEVSFHRAGFIERVIEPDFGEGLEKNTRYFSQDILKWLSSECIRGYCQIDGQEFRKNFSREEVIKLVANNLGGSHPDTGENRGDRPLIRYMLDFKVGTIPLPYIVIYKCAWDIIHGMEFPDLGK